LVVGLKAHILLTFIIYQWYVQPLDIKWDYFVCYRGIRYSTPNGYTLPVFLRQETLSMIMILTGVSTIPNSTYISSPIFKGCTLHKCCDLGWHICYTTVKEGSHILVEIMGAVFVHHYSRGSAWWLDIPRKKLLMGKQYHLCYLQYDSDLAHHVQSLIRKYFEGLNLDQKSFF
jgi:hypothetical protein